MVMYIASRRGNWFYLLMCTIFPLSRLPSFVTTLVRNLYADTWMQSTLVQTTECTFTPSGTPRFVCARAGCTSKRLQGHVLHVMLDPDQTHCITTRIDQGFDEDTAWHFLELPAKRCTNASFDKFFAAHASASFNHAGVYRNAMGIPHWRNWIPRLGDFSPTRGTNLFRTIGVRAGDVLAPDTRFFCSEYVASYLAQSGYVLSIDPCLTTPSSLLASLADSDSHFAMSQHCIDTVAVANNSTRWHSYFKRITVGPTALSAIAIQ